MENKWFIIVIVILSILTIGLGGFIVYDKIIAVKNEEAEKTLIGENEIDLNSFYKVGNILNKLDAAFNESSSAYFGYLYSKAEIKVENLDKNAALYAAIKSEIKTNNVPQVINGEKAKNEYEKMYGKSLKYKASNIALGENVSILYNKDTNYYSYTIYDNSIIPIAEYRSKNISTKLYEDEIVVKRKIYYVEYVANEYGNENITANIYKDNTKKKLIATINMKNGYINDEEIIAKYGSSISTYTYTFKEYKTDNYNFDLIKKEY